MKIGFLFFIIVIVWLISAYSQANIESGGIAKRWSEQKADDWAKDKQWLRGKDRVSKYLEIAGSHGISTIFVFMDDCWNPTYKAGKTNTIYA